MPRNPPRSITPPGRPVRASWLVAGAAVAVILTLISVWFTGQWYQARESNRLLVAIAEEVAAGHLEREPLEIEASEVSTVLDHFDNPDFRLMETPRLGRADEVLVGGRHSSIQGVSAAQLRFRSPDGGRSTWYVGVLPADQTRLLPDPEAGEAPSELFVRGLRIRIWTDQGLTYAEARAARG